MKCDRYLACWAKETLAVGMQYEIRNANARVIGNECLGNNGTWIATEVADKGAKIAPVYFLTPGPYVVHTLVCVKYKIRGLC